MRYAAAVVAAMLGARHAAAQLPEGPGSKETVKLCSQCHAAEVVMSVGQDRAGWAATLRKMGALGARGTDEEFRSAVDRYISDFEKLLGEVSRNSKDRNAGNAYLTSDTGKVYTMLAHASGRFD